jgi:transcriptional regulator with XRE-family HTH domain
VASRAPYKTSTGYRWRDTLRAMAYRLGATLKRLRLRAMLTQLELAQRARISQAYLSELETGTKRRIDLAMAVRLAKALGCEVTDLVR